MNLGREWERVHTKSRCTRRALSSAAKDDLKESKELKELRELRELKKLKECGKTTQKRAQLSWKKRQQELWVIGGEERNRPTVGEGMEESKQVKEDSIWLRLSECALADMQLRLIRLRRCSVDRHAFLWS